MCLIAFASRYLPDQPLVLIANRDEFYARPTAPAHFWDDQPDLLAGRDLQAGGTWLGITKNGRFAALTNVREPDRYDPALKSRGELTTHFLSGQDDPQRYAQRIREQGAQYNGFNLLVGTPEKVVYVSNRQAEVRVLTPGIYGLSNAALDTPWHKVERTKARLKNALSESKLTAEQAFDILGEDRIVPDAQLPQTGVPLEWERILSPPFIRSEKYGTRCATLLKITGAGQVTFVERTFEQGSPAGDRRFAFRIASGSG